MAIAKDETGKRKIWYPEDFMPSLVKERAANKKKQTPEEMKAVLQEIAGSNKQQVKKQAIKKKRR